MKAKQPLCHTWRPLVDFEIVLKHSLMNQLLEVLLPVTASFRWKFIMVNICCFPSMLEEVEGAVTCPAATATSSCSRNVLSPIDSWCKLFQAPYFIAESERCDFGALSPLF